MRTVWGALIAAAAFSGQPALACDMHGGGYGGFGGFGGFGGGHYYAPPSHAPMHGEEAEDEEEGAGEAYGQASWQAPPPGERPVFSSAAIDAAAAARERAAASRRPADAPR